MNNVLHRILEKMPDSEKKTLVCRRSALLKSPYLLQPHPRWGNVAADKGQYLSEQVSRTAQSEIWKFIEEELLAAISRGANVYHRPEWRLLSRFERSRQALMARVKLAQGNNSEAAEYA